VKAVISLTTIPDRIGRIGPVVASLVAQGLPVYVWAVAKVARSETRLTRVPSFPGASVEVVADRGPLTKLLPALERGFDVILTADDDVLYGAGWAAGLLEWADLLDGALGYRGRVLRDGHYSGSELVQYRRTDKPRRVDIVTGVFGALYRREMFAASIHDEWKRWPTNDDLVITAHLQRRGIPRYVVPGKWSREMTETQKVAPLHRINRRKGDKRNDRGIAELGIQGEL
jgi:hypothetical protein